MNIKYYKDKFGMTDYEIEALVNVYVSTYPTEVINLVGVAMDTHSRKINSLRQTQSILEGNHLFLYDVLDKSEPSLQDKLLTRYQRVPKDLVFDDDKIVKLLKKDNVV